MRRTWLRFTLMSGLVETKYEGGFSLSFRTRSGLRLWAICVVVGLMFVASPGLGETTSPAAPLDPSLSKQMERSAEYLGVDYQTRLGQESFAAFTESLAILARDPERNFLTDLCWSDGLPCAGDIRLYDWNKKGYGTVEPVLFTNRAGATISAHVWATKAGPARRPAIVITSGSIQATEQMYWWAAQALAKAGYVVITSDAQNQGRSDTLGEGKDADEGVIPQIEGNTFYDGTQDALDFILSTPTHAFCPRPARSGTSHCPKQKRRAAAGLDAAFNPMWKLVDPKRVGIAGHSYGAQGVSYVGQQDPRVKAIVAWDNLCTPTGKEGQLLGVVPGCQRGFQGPVPNLHTPALGISNDYLGGPVPHAAGNPTDLSKSSFDLSKAKVDTGEIVIRGGTHFEYSYLPFPTFPATLRGIDVAAWYTTAWFDKYVKKDPTADRRLQTTRWHQDSRDAIVDPSGRGNMFSSIYRSRMDIGLSGGRRATCEDIRKGCKGMAQDGLSGRYSYLAIVTSKD